MPEDEIIERMAMAIREVVGDRSGHRGVIRRPWDKLPEQLHRDYRREARAALEAALECLRRDGSYSRD
jgi:hypothetical protein